MPVEKEQIDSGSQTITIKLMMYKIQIWIG